MLGKQHNQAMPKTVPRLIKPKEAAEYLSISERKLWGMSKAGIIPAVRLGRSVRYDRKDLDAFIQQAKESR